MALWIVQFSHSVMSNFLRSHGLQHTRPPCPSTPRACSNSCPLYMCIYIFIHIYMYGDSIQPSHPQSSLLILLQSFPASGSFLMSQFFASGSQSYWNFSFSFSLSNEHPGPISFRMDWLDLLAVQGILKSLLQHHSSNSSAFSLLHSPTLTSIHDHRKNHSLD